MDEQFAVLDEHGQVTPATASKQQVHDDELRHGGAQVWIYNAAGELLMQFRDKAKSICPETWDVSVAGHIRAGETPIQTAIREAQEELSLQITAEDLEFIAITSATPAIMPAGKLHRVFDWNYVLKREINVDQLTLQKFETADVSWRPIDEVQAEILAPDYLKKYSYRDRYIFLMAIAEIRKRLGEIGTVS